MKPRAVHLLAFTLRLKKTSARRPFNEGYATSLHFKWGPLPTNAFCRITQYKDCIINGILTTRGLKDSDWEYWTEWRKRIKFEEMSICCLTHCFVSSFAMTCLVDCNRQLFISVLSVIITSYQNRRLFTILKVWKEGMCSFGMGVSTIL